MSIQYSSIVYPELQLWKIGICVKWYAIMTRSTHQQPQRLVLVFLSGRKWAQVCVFMTVPVHRTQECITTSVWRVRCLALLALNFQQRECVTHVSLMLIPGLRTWARNSPLRGSRLIWGQPLSSSAELMAEINQLTSHSDRASSRVLARQIIVSGTLCQNGLHTSHKLQPIYQMCSTTNRRNSYGQNLFCLTENISLWKQTEINYICENYLNRHLAMQSLFWPAYHSSSGTDKTTVK